MPHTRSNGLSRRRLLVGAAALAVSGAGALAGCSPVSRARDEVRDFVLDKQPPLDAPFMGPEPSSFVPPAPQAVPANRTGQVERVDVCVVGGGAAGMAAATSAARQGAATMLIEEATVLGGNVTRGLVNLDKVAYGGDQMVGGYFRELIGALVARGAAVEPGPETDWAVPAEVDELRREALDMAAAAGVDVRFGTPAVGVAASEDGIAGLQAIEAGRLLDIRARVYLDCTGDGHLGAMAGNGYWLGDRNHGQIQGQTLIFYAGPVDWERLSAYAADRQAQVTATTIIGLADVMARFNREHPDLGNTQLGMLLNRNLNPATVSISATEVYGNYLEPGAVTPMVRTLERQAAAVHAFLRKEVPGFEDSFVVRLADRPYLREGRRLVGYHQLTGEEIARGMKPQDSVARGWYPMDLHASYTGGPLHLGGSPPGDWYGIPYRCLVARDVPNLMMAGRCISVTHEALGSTRISPTSMATGQAAGIAAALAAGRGVQPADLAAAPVQERIVASGGLI